ncbi:hypothetical protein FQN50_000771 [Emmonsiellopsis sp. PD_5]|nr:hypothetical protein FQN50_000771 [Emmonsiellopsis sp. PD_5]
MNLTTLFSFLSLTWAIPNLPISRDHRHPGLGTSQFKVGPLPGNPILPPSHAGLIPIPGREEGNSIFFWLLEAEDSEYDDNLISEFPHRETRSRKETNNVVWLNGGPGCSSLIGALTENGPLSFTGNNTMPTRNPYSWAKLGHVLYIDQPVGTGLSTSSTNEPVSTNDQVTSDFYAWLGAFYRHFPHLTRKKTHMMGESYAGIFVPYFASHIVNNRDTLPINLVSISMGNGVLGNNAAMADVGVGPYMKSHASLLGVSPEILEAFASADNICQFDSVLAQANRHPPIGPVMVPGNPENLNFKRDRQSISPLLSRDLDTMGECNIYPTTPDSVLESILNSTCHGPCATFSTAADYLETKSNLTNSCFNIYNIKYDCTTLNPLDRLTAYINRADVQAALNVPQPTPHPYPFQPCNNQILHSLLSPLNHPTPPAYSIIPDLLTTHNISTHIYHGQLDMLVNHLGAELVLQNMTWNGAQGFQTPPEKFFGVRGSGSGSGSRGLGMRGGGKRWLNRTMMDGNGNGNGNGDVAVAATGRWIEERGLTYHLFFEAGHSVPFDLPREMFEYVRDVVVGGK